MSVLYLQRDKDLEVSIDGPALVVRAGGAARRLFPLQRLQRVHLPVSARVDSRVLVACARAGVIVAFTDRQGRVVTWCLPGGDTPGYLCHLLEQFEQRSDWIDRYQDWLRAQQQPIVTALADYMKLPVVNLGAVERESLRLGVRYAGQTDDAHSRQWLATEIQGLLVTWLLDHGVAADVVSRWAERLAPPLVLRMEPARLHWLRQRHVNARNLKRARPLLNKGEFIGFFGQRQELLTGLISDWVDGFAHHVEERR
jgi:hypothetical protein